jgi:hypothetical protein
MNLKTLSLAALAALFALPAVAADSGPDATVNVDPNGIECQSARIDAEDLLPGVRTDTDIWADDCEASIGHDGRNYRARCGPHGTVGPATVGPDCSVTANV